MCLMNAHQERQNIHDLLVRYCTGIDTRDWELFRGVFTPTCRLDYGPIGQWESAEAITAYMEATQMQFGHAMHRITNVAVTLQDSVPDHPERATARTYVSRLLTKLHARDRSQLVILSYESGLISPGDTAQSTPS